MARSKTIQINLKDGKPAGIKIAQLSNSTAKVFVIPRDEINFVNTRPELTAQRLDAIIKNTYRTLMTRGQKGCYTYSNDAETQKCFQRTGKVIKLD